MADMSTRAPRMAGSRRAAPRPAASGERPPPPLNWTTVKDAAARAQIHVATAYRHCENGVFAARRVGGSWRVRLASDGFPLPGEAA